MSAFDEAWGLIKAYTPNWREQAKNLPKIDEESVKEMMNPHDSAIGAGHSFRTYVHPSDPDFVAKVPKFEDWRMEDYNRWLLTHLEICDQTLALLIRR